MEVREHSVIQREILPFLAPVLRDIMLRVKAEHLEKLEEIRLRCGQPLMLRLGDKDYFVDRRGDLNDKASSKYIVDEDDIYRSIASISDNSLYAFEEEIRRGFITIPGGHRVGLAGQIIVNGNEAKNIKEFSGIAFRVAREIKGCAKSFLPYIYSQNSVLQNTLFISAPRCGKTTILRDVARYVSMGIGALKASNVVVVDERSELAGMYRGRAQMDLGPRTDVLDACPKALGMMMAVRSLSPGVIITDEIGRKEDLEAVFECLNAGVNVITSIHARSIEELQNRPLIKDVLRMGAFQNLIVLSRRNGPGTLEKVVRGDEILSGLKAWG